MNLTLHTFEENKQTTIRLQGEIDAYTAPKLKDALMPLVKKPGQKAVVDLQGVTYMDSTGLGVFVGALKTARKYDSRMSLVNLQKRIYRLFKITGLDQVIDIDVPVKGGNE